MKAKTAAPIARLFRELCHENTGKSLCDSGIVFGYHYDRPLPAKPVTIEAGTYGPGRIEIMGHISTAHFLSAYFELDRNADRSFRRFAARPDFEHEGWMQIVEAYAEDKGMKCFWVNTYNSEEDLTQTIQFAVLTKDPDADIYGDGEGVLFAIQSHNGADVRGGYSAPRICRAKGDLCDFWSPVCGFSIVSGTDAEGKELSRDQMQTLDEHWQVGYSSLPASKISEDVEKIIKVSKRGDFVIVRLKSGETVKVIPWHGCLNYI